MSQASVAVLLLGKNAKTSSNLVLRLERQGCECWFAKSAEEGVELFKRHNFQLVLSTSPVQQAMRIASLLEQSNCSVFCALPVEQGCWWLPLMNSGEKCLGAPALRAGEFVTALDQMLGGVQTGDIPAGRELQEVML